MSFTARSPMSTRSSCLEVVAGREGGAAHSAALRGEPQHLDAPIAGVRFTRQESAGLHLVDDLDGRLLADAEQCRQLGERAVAIFVVLEGALTARFGDREETVGAGGALIVPPGEEFTLVATGGAAEAVCLMPVGGQAIADGVAFTPPWAK
jgi:hypothetical protein